MFKSKIFLALVFIFFLATRLYKITEIPPSVYWDEASIGYNAYAIATDLKDEWGNFLPLHFRAFGEFKLPVYIYSVVPWVKIFGLGPATVRIPAVLYTFGTLFLIYLLTKKITESESLATLSVFILSVSPWLFIFSRTGYEATAGVFFFLLGTYLFLIEKSRSLNILFGFLFFILSFYSYNSFRIVVPIWLIFLTGLTFQKRNTGIIVASLFLFLVSLIPIYRLYKYDTGAVRFVHVQVRKASDLVSNYLNNFSYGFLFLEGDPNLRSQVPGRGELYCVDLLLILLGVWLIFKNIRKNKIIYCLPLVLLLLSPIPAAITKESPHALRSILAAPSFAMISVFGIGFITQKFKKLSGVILFIVVAIYLISFESYFDAFLSKYPNLSASAWQYGYKEIFSTQKEGVVTEKYSQPYIFALFYQQIPPSEFRSTVKYNSPDKWGFSLVSSFNRFEFK